MNIEINKEHLKAISAMRRNYYRSLPTKKIIEYLIEDYLMREHGRLGYLRYGIYCEK